MTSNPCGDKRTRHETLPGEAVYFAVPPSFPLEFAFSMPRSLE
jgi:hypothetical protein